MARRPLASALLLALALAVVAGAGATEQPSPDVAEAAAPSGAVRVDDWDWSGFSGLDDGPVIKKPQGTGWWRDKTFKSAAEVENARPDLEAPTRQAHAIFRDMPPFEVIPSQRDTDMHPCSNCHQWVLSDPTPRSLKTPHDNFELEHGLHGKGKFWCFTCHDLEGAGGLKTLEGEKLDFADAYVLCSQCHAGQARDWVYGAHGKRFSGWGEKRQVFNCTACHYQHRPGLKARAPEAGPVMRVGLERPAHWVAKDRREGVPHPGGATRQADVSDARGGGGPSSDDHGKASAGTGDDDDRS